MCDKTQIDEHYLHLTEEETEVQGSLTKLPKIHGWQYLGQYSDQACLTSKFIFKKWGRKHIKIMIMAISLQCLLLYFLYNFCLLTILQRASFFFYSILTLFLQCSLRFTAKLMGRYRDFLCTPFLHKCIVSFTVNISNQSDTLFFFFAINEPALTTS